jgi:hypothetical protein
MPPWQWVGEVQAQELAEQGRSGERCLQAGGHWTREQQQQWGNEERVRRARAAEMQKRVEMEEEEIRRNPEKVSKKIVGAIQNMGMKRIATWWTNWRPRQSRSGATTR